MMHWNSVEAFLAMGGYGFYVWSSFGLAAFCCIVELWQLSLRQKKLASGRSI